MLRDWAVQAKARKRPFYMLVGHRVDEGYGGMKATTIMIP